MAQWIDSIGEAETRNTGTAAFSVEIVRSNPANAANAAQWAAWISDPAKRSHTIERIVRDWKKTDPTAARSFVQSFTNQPAD